MHATEHTETHFTESAIVRDIVIGMSDGLTVPFALAAGLSGAISSTHIIVTAGLAEIVAGSISMGLGGYLADKGDIDHYLTEKTRETQEIKEVPAQEKAEVEAVLKTYGLSNAESSSIVEALSKRPRDWVAFMMRFELGLEQISQKRMLVSAVTIASAYAIGGVVPLSPYMFFKTAHTAFIASIVVTLMALGGFGFLKGYLIGAKAFRSAWQTMLIGGLAALASFLIAKAIS